MAYIDDLVQHIHNSGIASLGTSLFIGFMPETPDDAIVVIETGGMKPDIDLPFYEPTFQVLIRNKFYTTGRSKLYSVRDLFHQKYNIQLVPSGTYFYFINALSEGGHIGRDPNRRDLFSINFYAKHR